MGGAAKQTDPNWVTLLADVLAGFRDMGVEYAIQGPDRREGEVYALWRDELTQPAAPPTPAAVQIPDPAPAATPVQPASPPNTGDPGTKAAALARLQREIGDCSRCRLCQQRRTVVFGEGDPSARLMFVGEGPGEEEDRSGRPFVGRSGQLLDRMIAAMTLRREQVYIANVVKCRPPHNRDPEPDEIGTCTPFLIRQIEIIQPEVIVCLGAPAARFLHNMPALTPLGSLRNRQETFRGARLVATYHPSYLLRTPSAKAAAWQDLQIAMRVLGLNRADG